MPGNIIADIKNCYTESSSTFRELYDHMEKCHQYYNGKQFTSTDENTLTTTGNIKPELNLISKQVDSLIGKRITTLTDIKANPIEKDDLWISDLATRTLKWVIDNCNGQSHILRAHKDQILGGLGWIFVDLDMSKDYVSGDITIKYEKFSNILIDPHTEDLLGLSDCDYIQRFRTLNKSDLKKLFPDKAAEIDALKNDEADGSIFKRNTIQSERNQNVTVKEHWYRKFKTKTVIINLNDEEDQATEPPFGDHGADLLVAAERTALQTGDVEGGAGFADAAAGGAGGEQAELGEPPLMGAGEGDHCVLPGVVSDERNGRGDGSCGGRGHRVLRVQQGTRWARS